MKIFVTRKIPGENLKALTDLGHTVDVSPYDRPLEEEELVERVAGKDVLLSLLTDRIEADLMDAAGPQLKIISNYAVGFDNVDVKAAADRGIVVTNTPSEEVNEAVAEHTWALLMALARRVVESDEFVRQQGYFSGKGGYRGWEPDLFSKSDFVSLHVPLTEETRGMINSSAMEKMKQGAYLINTARGPVVDESD